MFPAEVHKGATFVGHTSELTRRLISGPQTEFEAGLKLIVEKMTKLHKHTGEKVTML